MSLSFLCPCLCFPLSSCFSTYACSAVCPRPSRGGAGAERAAACATQGPSLPRRCERSQVPTICLAPRSPLAGSLHRCMQRVACRPCRDPSRFRVTLRPCALIFPLFSLLSSCRSSSPFSLPLPPAGHGTNGMSTRERTYLNLAHTNPLPPLGSEQTTEGRAGGWAKGGREGR